MDRYVESLRVLLSAGADARLVDRGGRNALHLAAYRFQRPTVEALLQSGLVDVDAVDHEGLTPLHYASGVALRERAGFVMRLAPNALTASMKILEVQHRALIDRLESEALPVIDALLAAGADPDFKDSTGNSPLRFAESSGYLKIHVRLLQAP